MSDADTTRARIISAAGAVFAQKGFESATVREICQLAQANLAAINYHFGDKHQLYIEAVKRAHAWRVEQSPLPDWPVGHAAGVEAARFCAHFADADAE